jgi:hypothetical protein
LHILITDVLLGAPLLEDMFKLFFAVFRVSVLLDRQPGLGEMESDNASLNGGDSTHVTAKPWAFNSLITSVLEAPFSV